MKKSKVETLDVLISVMNLKDIHSFVKKTNIQSNSVIIDQCDTLYSETFKIGSSTVIYISTKERGLSNSRNMAMELASSDICLLCDDDESLYKGYQDLILNAYEQLPEADIIAFKFNYPQKKYGNSVKKIGYLDVPKISSVELTFKREKIYHSGIRFNTDFGSGSIYSAGEENLFLFDSLRKGLKIYFVPVEIGKLIKGNESLWFKGFNEKYFFDKGAWLSACFPKLKYIMIFYVTYRFRKVSELNILSTFKLLSAGMKAYKSRLSYSNYSMKL